MKRRRKDQ